MTSMLLEVDILGRDRVPVRNWHRSSVLAKPNEDDEAVSRQFHYPGRGVARSDVNADMHAGRPRCSQSGLDLATPTGREKGRFPRSQGVGAAPPNGADITGVVDPLKEPPPSTLPRWPASVGAARKRKMISLALRACALLLFGSYENWSGIVPGICGAPRSQRSSHVLGRSRSNLGPDGWTLHPPRFRGAHLNDGMDQGIKGTKVGEPQATRHHDLCRLDGSQFGCSIRTPPNRRRSESDDSGCSP